jgi:lysophospholipase L1-like esterase
MKMQAFGDSITLGTGASPSSQSYMNLMVPINSGVGGAQAADVSNLVVTQSPVPSYILNIGTNDVCVYKDNLVKRQYFEIFLRHCLAWISLPSRVTGRNMTTTGTWSPTQANSFGVNTTQIGATAKTTVSGNKIFVGYILQNHPTALSSADVYVDDILVGSISCDGMTVPINTQNNANTFAYYANACKVFEVSAGIHEVKIICTSSGKQLYVNYVVGSDQVASPVKVGNIIKQSSAGYSLYGVNVSTTQAYNGIIENVVSDFSAAELIDNYSYIDPSIHLADNLHPNNAGHLIINSNFS